MLYAQRDHKGIALITGLLLLFALSLIGITATRHTATDIEIAGNVRETKQAFYIAEAGISHAAEALKQNLANWGSYTAQQTLVNSTSFGTGSYSATIEDAGDERRRIVSTGVTSNGVQVQIEMILGPVYSSNSLFDFAAFGDEWFHMSGSNAYIDSYDSSSGPWTFATHNSNGDTGTNGEDAGDFATGNGDIYGDAVVGTNGVPATVITYGPHGSVTGTESSLPAPKDMTPKTDPGGGTNIGAVVLASSSTLTLNSDTRVSSIDLSAKSELIINGTIHLYVDGDVKTAGQSQITLTAGSSLTMYVSGDMDLAGQGIWNENMLPERLIIYGTSTCSSIKMAGQADFYGAIYAPEANFDFSGQADVFGSMIGDTVDITGQGDIHYDEHLSTIGGAQSISNIERISWRVI